MVFALLNLDEMLNVLLDYLVALVAIVIFSYIFMSCLINTI